MSSLTLQPSAAQPKPGATYKLVVRSADEAVRTIREQLGENAKVLSVRQIQAHGLASFFGRPKLEVIAQVAGEAPVSTSLPAMMAAVEDPLPTRSGALSELRDRAPLDRRDSPVELPELLRRSGFSSALIGRLESTPALAAQQEPKPLHHSLIDVGTALRRAATQRARRPLPARTAFLGTPGCGRSTALCKWLAREVFTHGRTGRVLKAEFDRPNPADGLAVFCEALGLMLEHASPGCTVAGGAGDFAYVDLPGLSTRTVSENRDMQRFLDKEGVEGRVLVLNAAYDLPTLRQGYAAGRDLGATHLVFTHLDELVHWGKLWDFLIEGELSPLFLSTGPGLTGDLEEDVVGAVLRKTMPGSSTPHLS